MAGLAQTPMSLIKCPMPWKFQLKLVSTWFYKMLLKNHVRARQMRAIVVVPKIQSSGVCFRKFLCIKLPKNKSAAVHVLQLLSPRGSNDTFKSFCNHLVLVPVNSFKYFSTLYRRGLFSMKKFKNGIRGLRCDNRIGFMPIMTKLSHRTAEKFHAESVQII